MSAEKDLTAAEQKAISDKANKLINLDKLGNIDEPMAEIAKNTTAGAEKESTNSINKTGRAQREKFDTDFEVAQVVREQKAATYRENAVTRNATLTDDLYSKQASTYAHQKDVAYEETQRKFRELGGGNSSFIEVNLADGGNFPSMTLDPVRNGAGVAGPWSLKYLNSANNVSPVTNAFGFPGPWAINTSPGPWKSGYVSPYQTPAQSNLIGTGWMTPYNELMTTASPYLAFAEHIPSFSFSSKFGLNPNAFGLSGASNSWQFKTHWANNASSGWTRPFSIVSSDLVPYSEATNSRTLVSYNQGHSCIAYGGKVGWKSRS